MSATFEGEVRAEWMHHSGDDRQMKLIESFKFVDNEGLGWLAPSGSVIDGASIPAFLWSAQGSPYVGDYRRASVIHDVYCATKSRPHKRVHRMFYDAMRCDGVGFLQAKKMYAAVRLFGPSWSSETEDAAGPLRAAAEGVSISDLETILDGVLGE